MIVAGRMKVDDVTAVLHAAVRQRTCFLEKREKRVEISLGELFQAQNAFQWLEARTLQKIELDIRKIAGILVWNERRHSLFDRPS